ncbi:TonB-dependent receptor [Algiphilus sp. W345]|uniref:TonB-dependent receptor n=1 Tax=Banduia mediterranea TaxID=3075609 RepID=A0ABU2WIS7_9GAMM|nr:TonB-dependent receptor [Algiphilus sp. W345]MDT0497778.1 TonB-dependent receptor [Algiphilus sp. W345]
MRIGNRPLAVLAACLGCVVCLQARAQDESDAERATDEHFEFSSEPVPEYSEIETISVADEPVANLPPPAEDPVQLGDVMVTSQKFRQTLREVPASVTVLDGEFLKQAKIQTINDINGYVPSTQVRVTPFAGEVRIRGYGTPPSNLGFESSVGAIVDDVYYGRTAFLSAILFDIDRFEVVRGPQGALFGKNTIAGVLNVATTPVQDYLNGDFMFTAQDIDTRDVRFGGTAPLAPDFGLRYAGSISRDEGLYYNTTLDRPEGNVDAVSSRLKFEWKLSDTLTLRPSVFVSDQSANSNLFQLAKVTDSMLTFLQAYDAEVEADASNERLSSNVDSYTDTTLYGAQLNVDWELSGDITLNSITAYAGYDLRERTLDFDASPAPFLKLSQADPSPYDQYSQELRLVGRLGSGFGTERSEFIVGAYGFYSDYNTNDRVILEDIEAAAGYVIAARAGGTPGGGSPAIGTILGELLNLIGPFTPDLPFTSETALLTLDQQTESYALFGQITSYLTDDFAVVAGLRLGQEDKEGHFVSDGDGAILLPIVTGQADHVSDLSRSESEVSPKFGVKYAINDQISTYAIWARGYKSGGFNALPFNDENLEFDAEEADSYELGVKSSLFGGVLQANLAAYLTDFDNLQVSTFTGTTFQVLNAAAARSQGVEGDLRWLSPWPGTELRAAFGYNDAYYRSYPTAPAPASSSEDSQDLTGRELALAPKWTGSLTPTVGIPSFWPSWGFQLAVDYLYTSERYLDVDLDPVTLQASTEVINMRLSAGAITGAWSLTFGVQNLTEEVILGQITDVPAAPGNYQAVRTSRGRQCYGVLRFQF